MLMKTYSLVVLPFITSLAWSCAGSQKPPLSAVHLRSDLDKKIVALNVELRDQHLAQVAQDIAMNKVADEVDLQQRMAANQVPYTDWAIYRSKDGKESMAKLLKRLRRLSPARCGLVDLPEQTAICARAVVQLNRVPQQANLGSEIGVQGSAQGSARIEEVLVLAPDNSLFNAKLTKDGRAFHAEFKADRGEGLYTVEVLARTGRGIEAAARWWIQVGSAQLPSSIKVTDEDPKTALSDLVQRAFAKLNQDRQAAGAKAIKWSANLASMAAERAKKYSKIGALAPAEQEQLAKLQIEGGKGLSRYTEVLGQGRSLDEIAANLLRSPSQRRGHLDPKLSVGAIAIDRDADGRLYLLEVAGRAYDPGNPVELRQAIVERINIARERQGTSPLLSSKALTAYAIRVAKRCAKRGEFFEKDEMGRNLSDAILDDVEGLQFAGSEMYRVTGVEEVMPGATPTNNRFELVGVGLSRANKNDWWVVVLVATPAQPQLKKAP